MKRSQLRMLKALRENAYNVVVAAVQAKIARSTYYEWMRNEDGDFAIAAYQAQVDTGAMIDAEIDRRGRIGVREPVFYEGKVVDHVTKFSDSLLLARAKAHPTLRNDYRDRSSVEHTGLTSGKDSEETEDWLKEIEANVIANAPNDPQV